MSALIEIPAQQLRPLLHRKLDELDDADLAAVHRQILEIEARRLASELGKELAGDWKSGRLSEESIKSAVKDHRAAHPYDS